jgi:hypothetical protein
VIVYNRKDILHVVFLVSVITRSLEEFDIVLIFRVLSTIFLIKQSCYLAVLNYNIILYYVAIREYNTIVSAQLLW